MLIDNKNIHMIVVGLWINCVTLLKVIFHFEITTLLLLISFWVFGCDDLNSFLYFWLNKLALFLFKIQTW